MALLEVEDLVTAVENEGEQLTVVDGISLTLDEGQTLGLVGESGCGKSITALSVMRLLPQPGARITGGSIRYDGTEITTLPRKRIGQMRGDQMSMIFQDPMTALNPVHRIGRQIGEMLLLHDRSMKNAERRRERIIELLRDVGIPEPDQRIDGYPHQLSGGMRQRVMIAMALACNPRLLIADEPTTALDVTIQAQIIDLIKRLQKKHGMAMLFITHDLGLVAQTCERVAVMYAGRIVEQAPSRTLFAAPRHPYTRALLGALPSAERPRKSSLAALRGQVPSPGNMPSGCRFANRCPHLIDACRRTDPPLELTGKDSSAACIRWREIAI